MFNFGIIAASGGRKRAATPSDDLIQYSIKNFGAASDGTTDDANTINAALSDNSTLYFEPNTTTIVGSAISVPSNRRIVIGENATVKLKSGAADYVFVNSDFVNGNTNITVEGVGFTSIMDGNTEGGQSRRLANALDKSNYWGFGMWFVKVEGLTIQNLKVKSTEAWGIAHYDCNNVLVDVIRFDQSEQGGRNGDGVTGFSSNSIIRNLSGYTNDDMVFIGAGGGSIGSTDMELPEIDIENILIENIQGEIKEGGTARCWRGVRVSGRDNHWIRNLQINNVTGDFEYEAVEIGNFWPDLPQLFIEDITLDVISRNPTAHSMNTVKLFHCEITTLNIYNLETTLAAAVSVINTTSGASCKITNFNIDGVDVTNNSGSDLPSLLYDSIEISNLNLSNVVMGSDSPMDYAGYIYRKTGNSTTRVVHTNCQLNQNLVRKGIGLNGGNNLSVHGTGVLVDKAELDPLVNDTVEDITSGIVTWNGTNWI